MTASTCTSPPLGHRACRACRSVSDRHHHGRPRPGQEPVQPLPQRRSVVVRGLAVLWTMPQSAQRHSPPSSSTSPPAAAAEPVTTSSLRPRSCGSTCGGSRRRFAPARPTTTRRTRNCPTSAQWSRSASAPGLPCPPHPATRGPAAPDRTALHGIGRTSGTVPARRSVSDRRTARAPGMTPTQGGWLGRTSGAILVFGLALRFYRAKRSSGLL